MSGYPDKGWRDNSNEQGIITDVTSCGVDLFRPRREEHFRVLIFSRYVLSRARRCFRIGCSLGLSPSLRDSNVRIAFQVDLPPIQNLWVNPSRPFSSWVFCMIIRRDVFALTDTILIFESWFFIPRIMFHGPAVPPCFTNEGSRFPGLPYLGGPHCFVLRVVDYNPSNCSLAGNAILSFKSWFSIP
jgi:hypothetical protein